MHFVKIDKGEFKVGNIVSCSIDSNRRREIEKNHSSTHILFHVLEDLLKTDLPQAGSSNDNTKLRFDFEYEKNIPDEIVLKASKIANDIVREGLKRTYKEMDIKKAKESGASYLKNEKYKDIVRVVSFGNKIVDMCGGTHVKNTSDIEKIHIQDIKSQGNGTYRLIAYSGTKQIDSYFKHEIEKWKKELAPTLEKVKSFEYCGERIDSKIDLAREIVKNLNNELSPESINRYVSAKDILPRICTEVENFEKNKVSKSVIEKYSVKLSGELKENVYSVYLDNLPKEIQQKLSLSLKANKDLTNKLILVANKINKESAVSQQNGKLTLRTTLNSLLLFSMFINFCADIEKIKQCISDKGGKNYQ